MGADQRWQVYGESSLDLSYWDARYRFEHHCPALRENRFAAQVRSFALC
jgi:hypothetical protein